jgi:hypothetical protein
MDIRCLGPSVDRSLFDGSQSWITIEYRCPVLEHPITATICHLYDCPHFHPEGLVRDWCRRKE